MPAAAIEARDVGRRYGRRWALARLDLIVPEGSFFLLVGANGSGKTTFLRLAASAEQRNRGELAVFGQDPARRAENLRAHVALLSHKAGLYEDLSARENLELLAGLASMEPRIAEWLAAVQLEDRPDPVRCFSAGMRKRLAFARLIAQRPRLALIDEPYGQLDPVGFDLVDGLMHTLRDQGATVVIASHLVERASRQADTALVLHQGTPRWQGPARKVPAAWAAVHRVPA